MRTKPGQMEHAKGICRSHNARHLNYREHVVGPGTKSKRTSSYTNKGTVRALVLHAAQRLNLQVFDLALT